MYEADQPLGQCELDTHADTWCVEQHARILHNTGRTVSVSPFLSTLGKVDSVEIVQAAIAYDDPEYSRTIILIVNHVLYFPTLTKNLVCPNQSRMQGLHIYDTPRHLDPKRHELSHTIYFPSNKFAIPLHMNGVISYFNCREPTLEEIDSYLHLVMTLEAPAWDPYHDTFSKEEQRYFDYQTIEKHQGFFFLNVMSASSRVP